MTEVNTMQSSETALESQTDPANAGLFGDAPPEPWHPTTASGEDDDGQGHATDDDPELQP